MNFFTYSFSTQQQKEKQSRWVDYLKNGEKISNRCVRDKDIDYKFLYFVSCYRLLFVRAYTREKTICLFYPPHSDIHRISIDPLRSINESCYF